MEPRSKMAKLNKANKYLNNFNFKKYKWFIISLMKRVGYKNEDFSESRCW